MPNKHLFAVKTNNTNKVIRDTFYNKREAKEYRDIYNIDKNVYEQCHISLGPDHKNYKKV